MLQYCDTLLFSSVFHVPYIRVYFFPADYFNTFQMKYDCIFNLKSLYDIIYISFKKWNYLIFVNQRDSELLITLSGSMV